jgi:hypothetical protein
VKVLQHFHHQQALIDRKCHGNVLTFANDTANLQNTAKMLKVVDAGISALREYTVQDVWDKLADVEFSNADALKMAQEAEFTNKFIREVTDEQKQKSKDKFQATSQGRSDDQKQKSEDERQATLQGRSDDQKQKSKDKRQATSQARSDDQKQKSEEKRQATLQARSDGTNSTLIQSLF